MENKTKEYQVTKYENNYKINQGSRLRIPSTRQISLFLAVNGLLVNK